MDNASPIITKNEVPDMRSLISKLKEAQPQVAAARRLDLARVDDIIERQRQIEGLRAAMRDPLTGAIFVGGTHSRAIESVPTSDKTGIWGRLSEEWDKGTENSGFVGRDGVFVSRTDAEARWDVLTMEDIKDTLSTGRARPRQ